MSWDLYLRDVLGIREVVLPESAFAAADATSADADVDLSQVKILFLIEPDQIFSQSQSSQGQALEGSGSAGATNSVGGLAEFELFLKMRAAMKIGPAESLIWEISAVDLALRETEIPEDWVVVSFSKKLFDYLRTQRPRLQMVMTVSPYTVDKDPKLKRQVWEDLKLALEKAGLSSRLQS